MSKIIAALSIALAALSAIIFRPTGEMIVSMPWASIFITMMMGLTYRGLKKEGAFRALGNAFIHIERVSSMMLLLMICALALAPFISAAGAAAAMIPIAIKALKRSEKAKYIPRTAVLISLSASAGGFLLPAGSFQNLVSSELYGISTISEMGLSAAAAAILIALAFLISMNRDLTARIYIHPEKEDAEANRSLIVFYACLSLILVLASLSFFSWADILILFLAVTLIFDRSVYRKGDWLIYLSIALISFALSPLEGEYPQLAVYALSAITAGAPALISEELALINAGTLLLSIPSAIGAFLMKKEGLLKEYWLYHVAIATPISLILLFVNM